MCPEVAAVCHLIQLGYTFTVLAGRKVFCPDIHGNLAEIQVGADPDRGGEACSLQHIPDDQHGKVAGRHIAEAEIIGGIYEHFIDGIDVNIFRRGIFQVDVIDACAVLNIK